MIEVPLPLPLAKFMRPSLWYTWSRKQMGKFLVPKIWQVFSIEGAWWIDWSYNMRECLLHRWLDHQLQQHLWCCSQSRLCAKHLPLTSRWWIYFLLVLISNKFGGILICNFGSPSCVILINCRSNITCMEKHSSWRLHRPSWCVILWLYTQARFSSFCNTPSALSK